MVALRHYVIGKTIHRFHINRSSGRTTHANLHTCNGLPREDESFQLSNASQ